ncbi:MAG: hypothetical protein GWM87_00695, partial [Xanthomonadales bacterium]|nr:hypothetical protein [Xanthomonadales bacterium]NIX11621.1 hypothetical protein [Xanthomonadales bacterium]
WLVDQTEGPTKGLVLRDAEDRALVWDRATGQLQPFDKPGLKPALKGSFETTSGTGVPVFELMA